MTKTEVINKLGVYAEWLKNSRRDNPIDLGLTTQTQIELVECAADMLEQSYSDSMTLDEYQTKAMTTCMPSCENLEYMLLNLVGEVGELCGKIAKHVRKGEGGFDNTGMFLTIEEDQIDLLKKELGDIMWQTAGVARQMGWSLNDVCKGNLQKLADRKQRNVIDGEGDLR